MNATADERLIDETVTRSVAGILPSQDAFKALLMSGKRLRVYIGADPTGSKLHLGHATNFILLEKLRRLGHEIVILFGDFTARIGDPTDKEAARRRLSPEEILKNIETWEAQISKVLSFTDAKNPARIAHNSSWLAELTLADLIDLASHFTVQQMLERDMFERRLRDKKPIYVHEFFYPLMQGYDSVALDVDAEVGGTDQMFNMIVGRDLQRIYHEKEKFVITTKLLEDPRTGKKLMSKSEGPFIALDDSPNDMFGKTMALPDEVILDVFTHSTERPLADIEALRADMRAGANPRDAKLELAFEIVKTYHNEASAKSAREHFSAAFQRKETPESIPTVAIPRGMSLEDAIMEHKLAASKSALRRLLKDGAVRNIRTGEKITDAKHPVTESITLKIGKRALVTFTVL
ncbi:MAG: tyrosine--tRNA ligase [Parcubacteria group bacterium]|nr:tyrosine--tRNA ligase [Parcubacteria group bacterium]